MRKILILGIALCACLASWAQVTLGFEGESASTVGIIVKELSSGKVIAHNDEGRAMVPASIMKSVTCAEALTAHGSDFRFSTPVYLYGSQTGSTWNGNLVIESVGDPTIESAQFKDDQKPLWSEIVAGLKQLGVTKISGRVIISEPQPNQGCNPEWEIEDTPYAYGAGWYGFNFQDNSYKLWPASGRTVPFIPNLHLSVVQSDDGTDMEQGVNSDNLTIYCKEPANPKLMLNVAMLHPAQAYEHLLKARLSEAGITVEDGEAPDESSRALVCEYQSPAMIDMLREMMYESHNLFAEGMLRSLAPGESRKEALKAASAVLKQIGVSATRNRITDGSGLSRATRLQPQFLANVLTQMAKSDNCALYVSTFPKVGKEGTVKSLLEKTTLKEQLALKSGSMGGVQCYAGYKLDAEGKPTHAVVIMVNSFFCPRGELRGCIEKFLCETFGGSKITKKK